MAWLLALGGPYQIGRLRCPQPHTAPTQILVRSGRIRETIVNAFQLPKLLLEHNSQFAVQLWLAHDVRAVDELIN